MTAAVEIYTRPGCGYCSAAKSLLTRKKAAFTELNVASDPTYREQMYDRAGAGATFPQIFIGATRVGGCDELHALDARAVSIPCWREKGVMMGVASYRAMVQMRSGCCLEPSLAKAQDCFREAAARARSMCSRRRLHYAAVESQGAARAIWPARKPTGHQGLSRARRGAGDVSASRVAGAALRTGAGFNRSFFFGPDGHVRAATTGSTSSMSLGPAARPIANRPFTAGRHRRDLGCPATVLGSRSATICVFRRSIARWQAGRVPRSLRLHQKDRRSALAHAAARPRHRERLLRVRGRPGRDAREQARDVGALVDHRALGRDSRRGRRQPGIFLAEIDPSKVETARKTVPSLQHGRRFRIADPKAGPEHLHLVRGSA